MIFCTVTERKTRRGNPLRHTLSRARDYIVHMRMSIIRVTMFQVAPS